MRKPFLISVDTEGDGLWWWKPGDPISTNNTKFLPRFQQLCDCFGFKPTYLTNWEMANDAAYAVFAKRVVDEGRGEVGMHLHAWNTPPICDTMRPKLANPGQDYLIEYDEAAMEEKKISTTKAIENSIGVRPTTHRAGRWAMDERYFRLLAKHGYVCDCSVSPALGLAFALVVFAGIYTSAVPLLWTGVRRLAEEGTGMYRPITFVGGVLGCVIACLIPYAPLLNVLYGLNGYLGFILMFFMIVNDVRFLVGGRLRQRS